MTKRIATKVERNSDFQAKLLQIKVNHPKNRKFVILVLTSSGIVFLYTNAFVPAVFMIFNKWEMVDEVATPSFAFVLLFMYVFVFQFFLACLAIADRFQLLNQHLM
jgi:hypothetical protein